MPSEALQKRSAHAAALCYVVSPLPFLKRAIAAAAAAAAPARLSACMPLCLALCLPPLYLPVCLACLSACLSHACMHASHVSPPSLLHDLSSATLLLLSLLLLLLFLLFSFSSLILTILSLHRPPDTLPSFLPPRGSSPPPSFPLSYAPDTSYAFLPPPLPPHPLPLSLSVTFLVLLSHFLRLFLSSPSRDSPLLSLRHASTVFLLLPSLRLRPPSLSSFPFLRCAPFVGARLSRYTDSPPPLLLLVYFRYLYLADGGRTGGGGMCCARRGRFDSGRGREGKVGRGPTVRIFFARFRDIYSIAAFLFVSDA